MEKRVVRKKEKDPKVPKANKKERKPKAQTAEELQTNRLGNMNRDLAKFALVDLAKEPIQITFKLVDMIEDKIMNIRFKNRQNVTCSCMDWRFRGNKNKFNCKHILYVATQILAMPKETFSLNLIHDYPAFEQGMERIKVNFDVKREAQFQIREDREITEEDICPVCYTDLLGENKENIINCLTCRGLVHKDCMACWLKNAANKSCVYCRDPKIAELVG